MSEREKSHSAQPGILFRLCARCSVTLIDTTDPCRAYGQRAYDGYVCRPLRWLRDDNRTLCCSLWPVAENRSLPRQRAGIQVSTSFITRPSTRPKRRYLARLKRLKSVTPHPFSVHILIFWTSAPREARSATNTLFIGNFPWSTTEDELREILSVYGPLTRVAVGPSSNRHPTFASAMISMY